MIWQECQWLCMIIHNELTAWIKKSGAFSLLKSSLIKWCLFNQMQQLDCPKRQITVQPTSFFILLFQAHIHIRDRISNIFRGVPLVILLVEIHFQYALFVDCRPHIGHGFFTTSALSPTPHIAISVMTLRYTIVSIKSGLNIFKGVANAKQGA